jgi:hypothetical protein
MRVEISTTLSKVPAGAFAVQQAGESKIEAITRSLERRYGGMARIRHDSWLQNSSGKVESNTYQVTMTRQLQGWWNRGTHGVVAEGWLYVRA